MAKISKIYDVLIIGAGAAGLFLAANLRGKSVAILEKNATPGKKILASGGGRCNVTNRRIDASNYLGDANFVKNILKNLDFKNVLKFFGELKFNEQKQNQFFCESGAKDVLGVLLKCARQSGAQIFCGVCVKSARKISTDENGGILDASLAEEAKFDSKNLQDFKSKQTEVFEVLAENGDKFYAKNLVVANGGLSYKSLGASGIGYEIAQSFGVKVVPPAPALVGFTVQKDEFWFKNLSGVCFPARIRVGCAGKDAANRESKMPREFAGDILFTHKGISGPAVLNASLFWQKGLMAINFCPNFSIETAQKSKKQLSTILPLPRRFTLEFLRAAGLNDKPYGEYKADEMAKILQLFDYKFAPAGTFGFERAEVTKGGIDTDELDANCGRGDTRGLYFIGEVLNVTGMLGGYNLHFAFACAANLAKRLNAE
ncbi:flavoprotein, HI0933 family [Campylobacter showae]|uniref:Flavoprotein family protein n=1 Tax=Campylobacter showae RM3277 TaxID=553219 RepID=C6RHD6_9BACT|nr:aminoacetone oxidase family FAD-binding enzyme [Campylobacter showae]EET79153.1 flavoprotein family protein [Campylobacter showae RM3277]QCD49674.1 flavoprotein, HI0933 family [Campylobacter showae]